MYRICKHWRTVVYIICLSYVVLRKPALLSEGVDRSCWRLAHDFPSVTCHLPSHSRFYFLFVGACGGMIGSPFDMINVRSVGRWWTIWPNKATLLWTHTYLSLLKADPLPPYIATTCTTCLELLDGEVKFHTRHDEIQWQCCIARDI